MGVKAGRGLGSEVSGRVRGPLKAIRGCFSCQGIRTDAQTLSQLMCSFARAGGWLPGEKQAPAD